MAPSYSLDLGGPVLSWRRFWGTHLPICHRYQECHNAIMVGGQSTEDAPWQTRKGNSFQREGQCVEKCHSRRNLWFNLHCVDWNLRWGEVLSGEKQNLKILAGEHSESGHGWMIMAQWPVRQKGGLNSLQNLPKLLRSLGRMQKSPPASQQT